MRFFLHFRKNGRKIRIVPSDHKEAYDMDDFREWLSDNLRYFMLGFGILAVVLILFFGVRFISSKFRNQKTTRPKQETQQETETPTPTQESRRNTGNNRGTGNNTGSRRAGTECLSAGQCTDRKILCSTDRQRRAEFKELVDELDPSDESAITNSQYIEGYSNVQVYTKKA